MRHGVRTALASIGLILATTTVAGAQERGFGRGYTDLGPIVGLGGIGSAGLAFGARFERAIKTLPSLGNGTLGIQVGLDYYNYDATFAAVDYGFKYLPIGATANYHIKVNDTKWDPFFGLGLGYSIVTTSYAGSHSSGIYFVGRAGLRYFMSNGIALYGDVGAGAATLNAGLMFRMAGKK
jgi:hypothetical protein